jgi:tRNA G18 (ribose-2'-O)-methylase SpoU
MRPPSVTSCQDPAAGPAREGTGGYGALGWELLLFGLQSPINIGMILRVAETYQFRVSIFDCHRILDDPEKLGTVEDFACGALERRGFQSVADEAALAQLRHGRCLIATSIERSKESLPSHSFVAGDLFVLGNEYDGLPDDLIASADCVLRVPMPDTWTPKPKARHPIDPSRTAPVARDGKPNLNVAMTAGIICYAAFADWLTKGSGQSAAIGKRSQDDADGGSQI